jgi:bleomycin hydrolase
MNARILTAALALIAMIAGNALAQTPAPSPTAAPDKAVYKERYEDPALRDIEAKAKERAKTEEEATAKIRAAQKERKEQERKQPSVLRFEEGGVVRPASPAAFTQAWHFPPQAQYRTGTCWSFGTTSFYESEVARLSGRQVKLSEMWTVYWEYIERMRRYVRERGDSFLGQGSEANALGYIWRTYGIVPAEAYPGVLTADGRHDHERLFERIESLAHWVKANNLWDEDVVIGMTRVLLDRELGPPPTQASWQGASYTPQEFLAKVLGLHLDDYVDLISTLRAPFYTRTELREPDNWRRDANSINVPLDEWFAALRSALAHGFTASLGGDVSEPGINGFEGIAVIPSFDMPAGLINQDARELRQYNEATTDDHIIHAVGTTKAGGFDWLLIKDSGRSARWGKFPGYYFYRADWVKLKTMAFTVHKDAVGDILAKVK